MTPARWILTAALLAASTTAHAQQSTADGVAALARGDFNEAVMILQPLAEDWRSTDGAAAFFMGTLYETGRGVPRDALRACALYARAEFNGGPFATHAQTLHRRLFRAHGGEWLQECQALANVGLRNRFEPASFTLAAGHSVDWTLTAATITWNGRTTRVPVQMAPRGAVFLPLQHDTLTVPGLQVSTRHFVHVFLWAPSNAHWNLQWFLYEVTADTVGIVASELDLASAAGSEPPSGRVDTRSFVSLGINDSGAAQFTVHAGSRPRQETIRVPANRRNRH